MSQEKVHPYFKKTKIYRLVSNLADLPHDGKPQVLMAGKSNVGKSSLLNRLCGQKKLARTSQAAGKTRNLIFFDVNQKFYLVDMPGYGFSKSSKEEQERFAELTDGYVNSNSPISLVLHVLDARHLPTVLDLQMIHWLENVDAPYTIVLNKTDKLSRSQQHVMKQKIHKQLEDETGFSFSMMNVSAETGLGIPALSQIILNSLKEK